MPAYSIAQRRLMGLALHSPSKVYKRNKAVMKMSKQDLEEFASVTEKGLSYKKGLSSKRKRNDRTGSHK